MLLERRIRGWGHACEIVAPSLIPRRPGERRKHDRKDAEELARLYGAGELVTIRVPSKRTSHDFFPRLTQDNENPTLTDGPSISAARSRLRCSGSGAGSWGFEGGRSIPSPDRNV